MHPAPPLKRWLISFVLILCWCASTRACIWITGTTKEGTHVTVSGFGPAKRLRYSLRADLPARGATMELESQNSAGITNRNDYAVALLFQGQYPRAIELLEQQEKEQPGEYFTAANLGTALELAGRNEAALKWINEGIRRNPGSHEGTEWLHARILVAKIQAAKNPDYFKQHSVLDLDYSQIERDAKTLSLAGEPRDLKEVERALEYQLKERLQFVRSADAPVASLLFDYSAIAATTHSVESAKELLTMALDFGYPADKVQPLLAKYDHLISVATIRQRLLYSGVAALVIALLIYAVKRRWLVYRGLR